MENNLPVDLYASRKMEGLENEHDYSKILNEVSKVAGDPEVGMLVDIGAGMDERQKEKEYVGRMVVVLGNAYQHMKNYSWRHGITVPPTPGPGGPFSTPAVTPARGYVLPPKVKTYPQGGVWMDLRVPPPGYAFIPRQNEHGDSGEAGGVQVGQEAHGDLGLKFGRES